MSSREVASMSPGSVVRGRSLRMLALGVIVLAFGALAACAPTAPTTGGQSTQAPAAAAQPTQAPVTATQEVAGAQVTPGAAAQAPKELKVHLSVAVTSPYAVEMLRFSERVNQRTNGALNFVIFPAAQLGNDRQALEGMRLHTIAGAVQNNMGGHPVWDMTGGPFLYRDRDHLWKVMRGDIGQQWIDTFLREQGIRVIEPVFFAPRHITSGTKPIRTPDDLNGFKIRVPDQPVFISMFRTLGANPVPLAFSELYTALQSKTVDGQENPLDTMVSSGFHEVQEYLSLTGHSMGTQNFMLDEQVWQGLTPDQQMIVIEEARTMGQEVEKTILANQEEYLKRFRDAGVEVIEPDVAAFRVKAQPFWDQEMVTNAWGPDLYDRIQAIQ